MTGTSWHKIQEAILHGPITVALTNTTYYIYELNPGYSAKGVDAAVFANRTDKEMIRKYSWHLLCEIITGSDTWRAEDLELMMTLGTQAPR